MHSLVNHPAARHGRVQSPPRSPKPRSQTPHHRKIRSTSPSLHENSIAPPPRRVWRHGPTQGPFAKRIRRSQPRKPRRGRPADQPCRSGQGAFATPRKTPGQQNQYSHPVAAPSGSRPSSRRHPVKVARAELRVAARSGSRPSSRRLDRATDRRAAGLSRLPPAAALHRGVGHLVEVLHVVQRPGRGSRREPPFFEARPIRAGRRLGGRPQGVGTVSVRPRPWSKP